MTDLELEAMREQHEELRRFSNEYRRQSIRDLLVRTAPSLTVHITLHEAVTVDEYGTITFAEWGGWALQVMTMLYNDRLVLCPKSDMRFYDFGWCYQKGAPAYLAALAWNPETEGEPQGFIKSIGNRARRAGERAQVDW